MNDKMSSIKGDLRAIISIILFEVRYYPRCRIFTQWQYVELCNLGNQHQNKTSVLDLIPRQPEQKYTVTMNKLNVEKIL